MNSFRKQRTLAMMTGFERYTKKTRRAMFLEEMEQVLRWEKLCALIEPHYPKPGQRATAERTGKHAADLFSAAVVHCGGPGGGRGLVRRGEPAAVCGDWLGSRTGAG